MNPSPPGLPRGCEPCWETIEELKEDVTTLKAREGMVHLSPSAWVGLVAVCLTVVLAVLGGAVYVRESLAALNATVKGQGESIADIARDVREHVSAPGHAVTLERTRVLENRIERVEASLKK